MSEKRVEIARAILQAGGNPTGKEPVEEEFTIMDRPSVLDRARIIARDLEAPIEEKFDHLLAALDEEEARLQDGTPETQASSRRFAEIQTKRRALQQRKHFDESRSQSIVKEVEDAQKRFGCFRRRYRFESDTVVHKSATCCVCRVIDVENGRKCVLKFMQKREQYDCEIEARRKLGRAHAGQFVVQVLDHFVMSKAELEAQADFCKQVTPEADIVREMGERILVMDRGEQDLEDLVAHDVVSGQDCAKTQTLFRTVATCFKFVEDQHCVHGDAKLRNIMIFERSLAEIYDSDLSAADSSSEIPTTSFLAWLRDVGLPEEGLSLKVSSISTVSSLTEAHRNALVGHVRAHLQAEQAAAIEKEVRTHTRLVAMLIDLD
eukprot:COSAG06_NODE_11097_length_1567_cov_1.953678_1_plen_376_part_10